MKPSTHVAQSNHTNFNQQNPTDNSTRQSDQGSTKPSKSSSSLGMIQGRLSHPKAMTVQARSAYDNHQVIIDLVFTDIIGKGTFGQIECAQLSVKEDNSDPNHDPGKEKSIKVAVKQVLQDPRYKNRELNIMQKLRHHSNIVSFYYYYYSTSKGSSSTKASSSTARTASGESSADMNVYLHLILECFPESLCDLIFRYSQRSNSIPTLTVKLFTYQMLKALAYLHSHSICHRDIKSSNLLVDETTLVLKVCDFGSAKEMTPNSTNVSYISSRYYRAPELLFGAQSYTCAIDTWSAGCVLAEMLRLYCLFAGTDSVDQLVKVIRVLGTPSISEIKSMNPLYDTYKFPNVDACPVKIYFPVHTPSDLLGLMKKMLVYSPKERITPQNALDHECFEELKKYQDTGVPPDNIPLNPHLFEPNPVRTKSDAKSEDYGSKNLASNSTNSKRDLDKKASIDLKRESQSSQDTSGKAETNTFQRTDKPKAIDEK